MSIHRVPHASGVCKLQALILLYKAFQNVNSRMRHMRELSAAILRTSGRKRTRSCKRVRYVVIYPNQIEVDITGWNYFSPAPSVYFSHDTLGFQSVNIPLGLSFQAQTWSS